MDVEAALSYTQMIADLQRQLREAQEQRDAAERERDRFRELGDRILAERDAAIERGEELYHHAIMATSQWDIWQEGCILEQNETVKQRRRAEAAEEDAGAQRALVERLIQLEKLRRLGHQTDARFDELAPAEALRAEHRSPQGGQEEGGAP